MQEHIVGITPLRWWCQVDSLLWRPLVATSNVPHWVSGLSRNWLHIQNKQHHDEQCQQNCSSLSLSMPIWTLIHLVVNAEVEKCSEKPKNYCFCLYNHDLPLVCNVSREPTTASAWALTRTHWPKIVISHGLASLPSLCLHSSGFWGQGHCMGLGGGALGLTSVCTVSLTCLLSI